jgi:hypothetical protein
MADKYLEYYEGKTRQAEAISESAGAADAGKIIAAGADGKIHASLLGASGGADVQVATASEALSAGAFVNYFDDAGTFSVRLADNSNARPAEGFVLEAVSASGSATVYPLGTTNSGLSGLIPGTKYWLGTVGNVTATALDGRLDTNQGYVSQYLGKAKSATELLTLRDEPLTL